MADGSMPSQASSTAARCAVRTATPQVLAGDPLLLPDNEQPAPGPKACAHVGGRCVPPLSSTGSIGRAEAGKRDQMVLRGKRHPDPSTTFDPPAPALGVSLSFASSASRVPPSAAALLAGSSAWQHSGKSCPVVRRLSRAQVLAMLAISHWRLPRPLEETSCHCRSDATVATVIVFGYLLAGGCPSGTRRSRRGMTTTTTSFMGL